MQAVARPAFDGMSLSPSLCQTGGWNGPVAWRGSKASASYAVGNQSAKEQQNVLKYIANDHASFKTYVANKVSLIQDNTDRSQWRYVSSKDNPADDSSRKLSTGKFTERRRWIHVPVVGTK